MTPYPELQQIIREETDNGRGIVRFLFLAMEGEFANFTPGHQLMASRVLAILGIEQGIQFVEANRKPRAPRDSAQRRIVDDVEAQLSAAELELADYTKKFTRSGRNMIRFFLDAMNGLIKSFSPSLRIAAAKELLGHGFPLLAPSRRRKAVAPKPQPQAQVSPESRPAPSQPINDSDQTHQYCSCQQCVDKAESRYMALHGMKEDEHIYQFIVRTSKNFTKDPERQLDKARRMWDERIGFIRAYCPAFPSRAFPGRLVESMLNDEEFFDDLIGLAKSCYCEDCVDNHSERDENGFCLCEDCTLLEECDCEDCAGDEEGRYLCEDEYDP